MSVNFNHLPPAVAAQLRAFYRRKRALGLLGVLASTLAVYGVLVLLAVHIDRFWLLSQADRAMITGVVHAVTALLAVVHTIWWFVHRGTTTALAYELEHRLGSDLHERIVTLHALTESGTDPKAGSEVHDALMTHLRTTTESMSATINAGGQARDGKLGPRILAVLVIAAIHGLLLLPASYQYPLMVQRFMSPGADLAKPSFVQITIDPEELVLGVGGEAVIQAETSGEMPAAVAWIMEVLGTATARCEIAIEPIADTELTFTVANSEAMTRIQRTLYLHTQSDVQESFRFRVRHGDAVTRTYTARVVAQPVVDRLALQVVPPEYSLLPATEIANPTAPVGLLKGTTATLQFHVNQATRLQELRMVGRDEPLEFTWNAETQTGEYPFTVDGPMSLEVYVENADGFANVDKAAIDIVVREDEPPSVRLESPTADLSLVPGELVPMRLVLEDDLGLAEAALRYQLNPSRNPDAGFQEEALDLGETPGTRQTLNPSFDLGTTGAMPGDEVLVLVRVRDTAGNDGQTRPLLIRVVAFTRGENERRRLAVLDVVRAALLEAAKLPDDATAAPTGFALSAETWTAIRTTAEAENVTLPETGSLEDILQLLEYELHFTDRPRHKTDLRYLYGQILAGALTTESAAQRAEMLHALATNSIPALTESRRLVNLYTRVFGLQAEADDIRRKLQELDAAGDAADPDTERAVKRRATLYLDVLQDLGEELITLAESQQGLDSEAILEMQGEMNSEAYKMKRGSVSRRLAGAEAVLAELQKLTALLAPPVPALMAKEIAARQSLATQHDALYSRAIAGQLAARWLRADGRLMDLNPYVTQYERARNLAALQALATGTQPAADVQSVPDAALAQHRRAADLAHQWEISYFATGDSVSAEETRLVRWTLKLTQDWWNTSPSDADVATVTPTFVASMSSGDGSVPLWKTQPAPTISGLIAPFDTPEAIANLEATLTHAETAQTALLETLRTPDADVTGAIWTLHRASAAVDDDLALMVELLSYRLRFTPDPAIDATFDEYLVLGLRAAQMRYQLASRPVVDTLASVGDAALNAGTLAQLQGDLAQLGVARTALANVVAKLGSEPPSYDEALQRYPALADYAATRKRLALVAGGPPTPESATTYIATFPTAGAAYLAGHADAVADAIRALHACRTALDQATPDYATYTRELATARKQLATIQAAASVAGDSDDVTALRDAITELADGRVARLDADNSLSDKELRRRAYDLSETIPKAERLLNDLRSVRADRSESSANYRGGPAGIWDDANHADAETARRRLGSQVLYAEDAVTAQILAGFGGTVATSGDAVDWAVFLHRIARSPLAGPVRTQPKRIDRNTGGDKFVDWLQKELANSRKAVKNRTAPETYDPITLEYLDSLKDFLRY